MKKNFGILVICLGILSGIVFFVSGTQFKNTGSDMKKLESESGTSLAEVYYQDMGKMNDALGLLAIAFAIGTIAISTALGTNLIFSSNNAISANTNIKDDNSLKNRKMDEELPPL